MRTQLAISYEEIVSVENLLGAWDDFVRGKRKKRDVQEFGFRLMDNIFELHSELVSFRYKHSEYWAFKINDPKPRDIHKASVRDILLHHAIYRKLYPFFDRTFVDASYSCRKRKGTHKACDRFAAMLRSVGGNNTCTVWVLQCDVRKFFASIDHQILFSVLRTRISDKKILWLLYQVVGSFSSGIGNTGLPLGNLTSQLLVNIYMNEFDQFVKHTLRARYYIRYADDFAIVSTDRIELVEILDRSRCFLLEKLKLELHPSKVSLKTFVSGVDFLGWVHFPHHRILRASTKKWVFRRLRENPSRETVDSYRGMLSHGNAHKLEVKVVASVISQSVCRDTKKVR